MQAVKIIAMSILAAVLYGILHDQITARICVEYFTIGHPQIFGTESPTLLAVGWGILATWWVGLLIGVPLCIAARRGPRPKRSPRSLWRPILLLLAGMGFVALIGGGAGFALASSGVIHLVGPLATEVPAERHVAFMAAGGAHTASYLAGFVGGIVLIRSVWRSRRVGAEPAAESLE